MIFTRYKIPVVTIVSALVAFLIWVAAAQAVEIPGKPTNVAVSERASRSAVVSWDTVAGADSYIVEVSGVSGTQVGIFQNITGSSKKIGAATLKSNKEYYVKVKAVNEEGGGFFSAATYFRTKPAQVVDEVIIESGSSHARLQWHKPRGEIRYYLIQVRRKGMVERLIKKTTQLEEPFPTELITGLRPTRKYHFRVRGVYNKSNKGPYSDSVILPKRSS